ncbi:MAG: hypothetical protein ACRELX_04655, partial [Longimicrobiales bacterium]
MQAFARDQNLVLMSIADGEEVIALVNRTLPAGIVIDAASEAAAVEVCSLLKSDPFSAIVPVAMLAPAGRDDLVLQGLEAGADEVLTEAMERQEQL